MASSTIYIEDIGSVRIYRRRGLRNIRITVENNGSVRLSLPWYVPKSAGLKYIASKREWIKKHQAEISHKGWEDGQRLTENHVLKVHTRTGQRATSIAGPDYLQINLPESLSESQYQKTLDKKVTEFLREQCIKNIVPSLFAAAKKEGFKVKEVKVKKLKSRWGSCSQERVIVLNLSLARLPSSLSEYVIYHELAHTRHLNHSKDFWEEVGRHLPDYKERRKALRRFNPSAGS